MANQYVWLFFGFSGRASRAAYALAGLLLYMARVFPIYRIVQAGGDESVEAYWGGMFLLVIGVTLISHIALSVKRLHDMNQSGWWSLLMLVGDFLFYLVLCFIPGTNGPNRYGSRPDSPT